MVYKLAMNAYFKYLSFQNRNTPHTGDSADWRRYFLFLMHTSSDCLDSAPNGSLAIRYNINFMLPSEAQVQLLDSTKLFFCPKLIIGEHTEENF